MNLRKSTFVTIDPGINTGYAFYNQGLSHWGVIRGRGKTFEERVEFVVNEFREKICCCSAEKIYIEWPSFQNLAAQRTFSIPKLAFLIGRLYETCFMYELKPVLIPVSKYRGNCPKEVLWNRARKYFNCGELRNHEGDAVAMAMWILKNDYNN